jgi:uncharacterized protein YecT (DUF1311 family)
MMRWTLVTVALFACGSALAAEPALYTRQDCNKAVVQMDLNACADANAQAADAALNTVYKNLQARLPDEKSKTQLRLAERKWIAFRDKDCAASVGPQEDGGSIWPMEMSNCLEDKTAARLRELKRQLDCPQAPAACPK